MSDSLIPVAPDFGDPLGVLRACHERMLLQCEVLEKLPAHIDARGVDDEAQSAITQAVKYFSNSAVDHHQDEEEDLFPLLIHASPALAELIRQLRREHDQLEAHWKRLAELFREPEQLPGNPDYPEQIQAFCDLYRTHIRLENEKLLTPAQAIVSLHQLSALGAAMAKRRGLRSSAQDLTTQPESNS